MKYQETFLDKIKKNLALIALKIPLPIMKLLIGKPTHIDGQTMDTVVQFMLKYFSDTKVGYIPTPEKERRDFDIQGSWFAHNPEPSVTISKWSVINSGFEIPCEIHRPNAQTSTDAPALLYFHGGGHLSGSLDSHRNLCRQLAYELNCVVIAVDYRLAPEYKFPIGINDCLVAYDAVVKYSKKIQINPNRISVAGDSAGGNISAVIAQQRKSSPFPPKFQALWAPWVDMSKQTPSYELMGKGLFLEKVKIEYYTSNYLNSEKDRLNPLASPLLGDVEGLCPAAIFSAGFDPLRDEGKAYAEKLKAAGVPTYYKLYDNVIHPFVNVAGKIPIARLAFDEAILILKKNI